MPSAEDSEEESVGELLEDSLIEESLEESLDESEEEFSDKELSEILSDDTEPFCEESDAATDIVSAAHVQTARAISSFLLLFFLITYYVPPYSLISQPLFCIF